MNKLSDKIIKEESAYITELPSDAKIALQFSQDEPCPHMHIQNACAELRCRVNFQIPSGAPIDEKRMIIRTAVGQVVFSLVGEPVALLHQARWKLAQYKNAEAKDLMDRAIELLS